MAKYIIEAIIFAFLILFADWNIGYWYNGVKSGAFDLKSCWDGFATLGGAGLMGIIKYITDSFKNSQQGHMPYEDSK